MGQFAGVAAIGLHAVARFTRNQGRSDHDTINSRFAETAAKPESGGAGLVADPQDLAALDQRLQHLAQLYPIVGNRLPSLGLLSAFAGKGNHDRILVYIHPNVNYTSTHWTSPFVCGSVEKGK